MRINSVEALAKWKAAKPSLFSITRIPRSERAPLNQKTWLLYRRQAKRGLLYVGGLRISWRRPATLASLWAAAWDPGWRSGWEAGYRTAQKMLRLPAGDPNIPPAPRKEEESCEYTSS